MQFFAERFVYIVLFPLYCIFTFWHLFLFLYIKNIKFILNSNIRLTSDAFLLLTYLNSVGLAISLYVLS